MFAKLITMFLGLAISIPGRVLAALGIGWISYAAVSGKVGDLVGSVLTAYSGIPADVLALLDLAGFGTAIGIITGCMIGKAALLAVSKLSKLTGGA